MLFVAWSLTFCALRKYIFFGFTLNFQVISSLFQPRVGVYRVFLAIMNLRTTLLFTCVHILVRCSGAPLKSNSGELLNALNDRGGSEYPSHSQGRILAGSTTISPEVYKSVEADVLRKQELQRSSQQDAQQTPESQRFHNLRATDQQVVAAVPVVQIAPVVDVVQVSFGICSHFAAKQGSVRLQSAITIGQPVQFDCRKEINKLGWNEPFTQRVKKASKKFCDAVVRVLVERLRKKICQNFW